MAHFIPKGSAQRLLLAPEVLDAAVSIPLVARPSFDRVQPRGRLIWLSSPDRLPSSFVGQLRSSGVSPVFLFIGFLGDKWKNGKLTVSFRHHESWCHQTQWFGHVFELPTQHHVIRLMAVHHQEVCPVSRGGEVGVQIGVESQFAPSAVARQRGGEGAQVVVRAGGGREAQAPEELERDYIVWQTRIDRGRDSSFSRLAGEGQEVELQLEYLGFCGSLLALGETGPTINPKGREHC